MKALTIFGMGLLLGAVVHAIEPPQTVPTNNLQNSIAYRSAALERMTQEASWACIKLRLISQPFQPPEITSFFIVPPRKMGFSGTMQTTNYYFRFGIHGKLDQISDQSKHPERFDLYSIWAKMPSLVDTNGAYQLATQWLSSIAVNVPALEKKYPHSFRQWFRLGEGADLMKAWKDPDSVTNKTMLPIFDVRWGEGSAPPVKVTVFGPTKELAALEMNDISFSRRHPIVITNWEELINIPDPPKKQLHAPVPRTEFETNASGKIRTNPPAPFRRRINAN